MRKEGGEMASKLDISAVFCNDSMQNLDLCIYFIC